ncbi:hypothetical protein [Bacillus paramycoides]|uniref:hypothetical protein n=1 Tax=Bacillus paramycoides TaxID=2026194 RepID=UPI002E21E33E|nr:hypothetical protein [Bacillus paramycoides]
MGLTKAQEQKLKDINTYAMMWLQGKIDGDYFLEVMDEVVYPDPADTTHDITAARDRAVEKRENLEKLSNMEYSNYPVDIDNKTNEYNERK